jgi:hypothetical protein
MITRILTHLQASSSTPLIFFFLRFVLATLLILVFILPEEMGGSWPLIPNMSHLLLSNIILLPYLGPIARISPFLLFIAAPCRPHHVDAECEVQLASRSSVSILNHIDAWEWLGIDLHHVLT